MSYMLGSEVVGNPIDFLPAQAQPHIHSAAALSLVFRNSKSPAHLDGWLQQLQDGLSRRVTPGPGQKRRHRSKQDNIPLYPDLWPKDAPGEEAIPSVVYLTTSRRPISADPHTDQMLALLEALARLREDEPHFLEEALQHEAPLVRQSAERLLRNRVLLRSRHEDGPPEVDFLTDANEESPASPTKPDRR